MKLQKIVSRLQELHPKEIDLSLDRIQNLCKKLGNPQDKIKAISIVGCGLRCNSKLSRQVDLLLMVDIYSSTFPLPAKAEDRCK